jgi:hypothetical protein
MNGERKRDIFVVMSGATPLHAVCTEKQARRFCEMYGHPAEDCRLFLGMLSYHKVKLIPPRKLKPKQLEAVKKELNVKTRSHA